MVIRGDEQAEAALVRALGEHEIAFHQRYGPGGRPRLYFSPGRVNLMGAHLDYNGGPVLPTAIDRGTFIAVRARTDARLRMASTFDQRELELDLGDLPGERMGHWADYPLGVVIELLRAWSARGEAGGLAGLEILFGGNLAVGAGLSSSASICVGTALALDALWGLGGDRMSLVHAALAAERGFVGVQCGIMDPYAVGLARPGQLLWLDCKDASSSHLPFDFEHLALAVVDSGVRRGLAEGAFNQRVAECRAALEVLRRHQPEADCLRDIAWETLEEHREELEPPLARRAQHVLREVARTFAARELLLAGQPQGMGALMSQAHDSLRDLYEVSCPELDAIIEIAQGVEGVLGGRLTGAGFGGCAVVLLQRGAEAALQPALDRDFRLRFGRAPSLQFFGGDRGPREIELR